MKVNPDLKQIVKQYHSSRLSSKDDSFLRGTHRVDLEHLEQLTCEIKTKGGSKQYTFISDEPRERGGHEKGAAPLQYFLAGAGSCLLTQYARLAIAEDMSIDTLALSAIGHIDRSLEGAFTDIIFEVRINSEEPSERIVDLASKAEKHCFVSNTLRKAIPMKTKIYNNTALLYTFESSPKI